MQRTSAGLPNTCSQCGQDPGPFWYAASDEAATAGLGVCPACHTPPSAPAAPTGAKPGGRRKRGA